MWVSSILVESSVLYISNFMCRQKVNTVKLSTVFFFSLIDVSLLCIFWLEYCRYGVNENTMQSINQSINQSIKGRLIVIPVWFSFSQYLASYLRSDFTLHFILHSFTNAITLLTMNILYLILFLFSTKLDSSDYFINCSFL